MSTLLGTVTFWVPSSLHFMNRMHSVIQLTQFLRVGNTLYSFFPSSQVIDAQKWFGSERINKKAAFPQLTGQLTYRWVLRHRPIWMTICQPGVRSLNYFILPYISSLLAREVLDASGSISSFRLETLPCRLPLLWWVGLAPSRLLQVLDNLPWLTDRNHGKHSLRFSAVWLHL